MVLYAFLSNKSTFRNMVVSNNMNYIKLLRPQQWIKNLFIFLPLFFSTSFGNVTLLRYTIITFFAFSFVASSVYCFNDIVDIDYDRLHPLKRLRPIASGAISISKGYLMMILCVITGLAITCLLPKEKIIKIIVILLIYLVLNIAYCLYLKKKSIVDVFTISLGFVLRLLSGSAATGIEASNWIVLMTFLICLFIAFAKRRDDVIIFENTGVKSRKNAGTYNITFINTAMTITAAITIVCYIMYTVSPEVISRLGTEYVYATSFFVIAGIIRYLQITFVDGRSGSPTKILLKDRFLQGCIILWLISFTIIIYL
jgi:decaprenyl-phosphate phosphoribosyltransferase